MSRRAAAVRAVLRPPVLTRSLWVALVDGFFSPRFTVPGVFGAGIVLPTVDLPPRTVTTTPDTINFGIPNHPVLVGVSLAWQGVVILPTSAVLL